MISQGSIEQIHSWDAHTDAIRSIKYITATDTPLVFTASLDKMACIWDLKHKGKKDADNCKGKLIQGYMMKNNYHWDFPLKRHEEANE